MLPVFPEIVAEMDPVLSLKQAISVTTVEMVKSLKLGNPMLAVFEHPLLSVTFTV